MAAFVGSKSAAGSGSVATTAGLNTTGANLLVAIVAANQAITMSDSLSNTWTALSSFGTTPGIQIFYVKTPTVGSSQTFTATTSGGFPALAVLAFSGATSTPLDQNTGSTGTGVTSQATGSVTPVQSGEIIVAGRAGSAAISGLAINSGFTLQENVPFSNSVNFGVAAAYLIQGAAATVNPTWSWTTSDNPSADIATFEAVVAATAQQHLAMMGVGS